MVVRLPPGFTDVHKEITRRFVQAESFSQAEPALLFEAFDLLHKAEASGGHPFGAEMFSQAITLTAKADTPRVWDVLFASLDRFRVSENVSTRRIVTEFFDRHDRAVIERALRDGFD